MGKKTFLEKIRTGFGEIRLRIPLPVRLPWGDWWLPKSDAMDRAIRSSGGYEPSERLFIERFLKSDMVVFDIGAHHGFFSLLASHKVGKKGKIFAFEPSPREHASLTRHLKINHRQNVHVEQLALSDSEGQTEFYICLGRETGCNSLRPPDVSEKTSVISVKTITLDKFLSKENITHIDFVKLDVEGAEIRVLKGATGLLNQKSRPVFLCELSDMRTKPWGYNACEIHDFLISKDFKWFSISESGFLIKSIRKETYHENLVAIPSETLPAVKNLIV